MYLAIASAFGMPCFALHAAIFALSIVEDKDNYPLSLLLVANNDALVGCCQIPAACGERKA
jgi:hypothetical protein